MTDVSGVQAGASGAPATLPEGRRILGEAARLWVAGGTHIVEDGWWAALSGRASVDYNVVCWHGPDPAIADGLDLIAKAKVPAVQMLAGPALGSAQLLADAEWVCIGTTPVMRLDLATTEGWPDDPAVQIVGLDGLAPVHEVVATTFGIPPELAAVAVPELAATDPDIEVWSLVDDGVLKSCVAIIMVDGVVVGWSMATPPSLQRQGLGRRLLMTLLRRMATQGRQQALCYASAQGEPLYAALGFEVTEHWQVWSKPRWVLGRA